eukprot:CAMPEP_0184972182 /NCGR_PEP_ID=MMETSP1098-20130426/4229_1 /TAXON_ID=89044 /ORGANISM="Spumella elongata, Strain CCAP 955/1" /LENGTH=58 /DNA_ID=CAMNT_0027494421 /DNA_START=132 /DNA_END=308 /DNA_ORIENTATION=+
MYGLNTAAACGGRGGPCMGGGGGGRKKAGGGARGRLGTAFVSSPGPIGTVSCAAAGTV